MRSVAQGCHGGKPRPPHISIAFQTFSPKIGPPYLKEAKARVERTKGTTWVQYLMQYCPVGKSRSYELIAIADGRKTVEEVRERSNTSSAASRSASKTSAASGQSSPKTEQKQSRSSVEDARDEVTDHHDAMLKRVIAMVKKLEPNQLEALENNQPNAKRLGLQRHEGSFSFSSASICLFGTAWT